jgi:hypothetical protein
VHRFGGARKEDNRLPHQWRVTSNSSLFSGRSLLCTENNVRRFSFRWEICASKDQHESNLKGESGWWVKTSKVFNYIENKVHILERQLFSFNGNEMVTEHIGYFPTFSLPYASNVNMFPFLVDSKIAIIFHKPSESNVNYRLYRDSKASPYSNIMVWLVTHVACHFYSLLAGSWCLTNDGVCDCLWKCEKPSCAWNISWWARLRLVFWIFPAYNHLICQNS